MKTVDEGVMILRALWSEDNLRSVLEDVRQQARAEFAREAARRLRNYHPWMSADEDAAMNQAADIVEALARPLQEQCWTYDTGVRCKLPAGHEPAHAQEPPKCHADCTYECCGEPPGRDPNMFTIAPDVTQGINTVDFRGFQPAMCACGIPVGKGHRGGCPTQAAACMHDYQNGRQDTCSRCGARL
jgi:hypothetical protein